MITVTEEAVNQLRDLLEARGAGESGQGLRLAVERGGCAGMQYTMRVAAPEPSDLVVESGGVKFFVDDASRRYLDGCEIDYEDSLTDAGFKVRNPNAARNCGCGSSFEPAT
jgi:iron-sulfur cluster assembly protein